MTETNYHVYIITDLRTNLQVEYVKKHIADRFETKYVRVNCSDETKSRRGWMKTHYDDSPYETELDNYDGFNIIVDNNGTFDEFKNQITKLVV